MRVFITGATGFVGSAVVQELLRAGHEPVGLARSESNAQALIAAGAQVHYGDLENLESIKQGASNADAVIHCGFIHDFSKFKENCEIDQRAIETLGSALMGTDRQLIVTSGVGVLSVPGRLAVETDKRPVPNPNPRMSEEAADALTALGVRTSIVRLPPTTHGEGDHGFVPMIINLSKEKGVVVYTEDGNNRWPAAHRFDAATLYRLALETQAPSGTRYHAVAEEGVAFRDIAEAIGKGLNIPVESKSPEEAAAHFGWFAHFAGMDCASSAQKTKEMLGWQPVQPGLLEDLKSGGYFK